MRKQLSDIERQIDYHIERLAVLVVTSRHDTKDVASKLKTMKLLFQDVCKAPSFYFAAYQKRHPPKK